MQVRSQDPATPETWYNVKADCLAWGVCTCPTGMDGLACKHQLKVLQLANPHLKESDFTYNLGICQGSDAMALPNCDGTTAAPGAALVPTAPAPANVLHTSSDVSTLRRQCEEQIESLRERMQQASEGSLRSLLVDLARLQQQAETQALLNDHTRLQEMCPQFVPRDDGTNNTTKRLKPAFEGRSSQNGKRQKSAQHDENNKTGAVPVGMTVKCIARYAARCMWLQTVGVGLVQRHCIMPCAQLIHQA